MTPTITFLEPVCSADAGGTLALAVNGGSAGERLGMDVGDRVVVASA